MGPEGKAECCRFENREEVGMRKRWQMRILPMAKKGKEGHCMFRTGGDLQGSFSNPSAGGCADDLVITKEQENIDLEMKKMRQMQGVKTLANPSCWPVCIGWL